MTNATNCDILIGQLVLYAFDFGLDNWIKEEWIKLEYFINNEKKKFISIKFLDIIVVLYKICMKMCQVPNYRT